MPTKVPLRTACDSNYKRVISHFRWVPICSDQTNFFPFFIALRFLFVPSCCLPCAFICLCYISWMRTYERSQGKTILYRDNAASHSNNLTIEAPSKTSKGNTFASNPKGINSILVLRAVGTVMGQVRQYRSLKPQRYQVNYTFVRQLLVFCSASTLSSPCPQHIVRLDQKGTK
jgi:hypothetical protein